MANKPNNPALWSKAKSLAKQKFDVYPSAYSNGWAAKWYKSKGGTWSKAEYGMEIMQQGGEPDGSMALGQISAAIDKLEKLRQFIKPESDLEPWVSSKLTMMDHYTDAVSDYMMYNPEAQMDQGLPMQEMAEGGIPERYRNMGFTKVGAKKQSTRPGKKWMVLAKKGDQYKVVHGGYDGMKDYTQHGNEKRRERFWDRMGGRNSAKATDPFSPLYWHKRFGTWKSGGEPGKEFDYIPSFQFGEQYDKSVDPALLDYDFPEVTQMLNPGELMYEESTVPQIPITGLVDYLDSIKVNSSKEYRKRLAQAYGIKNYDYSAKKNNELMRAVIKDYTDDQTLVNVPPISRSISARPKSSSVPKSVPPVNTVQLEEDEEEMVVPLAAPVRSTTKSILNPGVINQAYPFNPQSFIDKIKTSTPPKRVQTTVRTPKKEQAPTKSQNAERSKGVNWFSGVMNDPQVRIGMNTPVMENQRAVLSEEGDFLKAFQNIDGLLESGINTGMEYLRGLSQGLQRKWESMQSEDERSIIKTPLPKPKSPAKKKLPVQNTPEIDYGYQELYTVPDVRQPKDSLLAFMNVFDNDEGGRYYIGHKAKEVTDAGAQKEFDNVRGVAHFLRDSDILPNQKITPESWNTVKGYTFHTTSPGKTVSAGQFDKPDHYRMLYRPHPKDDKAYQIKYIQNKNIDDEAAKKLAADGWGLDFTVSSQHRFSDIDWDGKGPSTGYAAKSNWLPLKNGQHTYIPYKSKDGFSRYSGGSGIYLFKDPKSGKKVGADISGSVNAIRKAGEELIKKYGLNPDELTFAYHDMGSYSAKPKAHDGKLNYNQWLNYNNYNRGFSGAPIMIPLKKRGGSTFSGNAFYDEGGELPKAQVGINSPYVTPIWPQMVNSMQAPSAVIPYRPGVQPMQQSVNLAAPAAQQNNSGFFIPEPFQLNNLPQQRTRFGDFTPATYDPNTGMIDTPNNTVSRNDTRALGFSDSGLYINDEASKLQNTLNTGSARDIRRGIKDFNNNFGTNLDAPGIVIGAKGRKTLGKIANITDQVGLGIGVLSSAVDQFITNPRTKRENQRRVALSQMSDSLNYVQPGSRGDYVATGTSTGMFRPDQYVVNKGMYTSGFYPSYNMPMMQDGGAIDDELDVAREMIPNVTQPVLSNPGNSNNSVEFTLTSDFQQYADKADQFLRSVAPNTDISGEMLAAGAQMAYEKTGKIVPVELALAQLMQEGYLAKGKTKNRPQRTRNPFNVGNTDDGKNIQHNSLQSGINSYYNLMSTQYLNKRSPEQLLENFVNSAGNRYATDRNYEQALKNIIQQIKLKTYEEGGEYELTEDEIKYILSAGGNVEFL